MQVVLRETDSGKRCFRLLSMLSFAMLLVFTINGNLHGQEDVPKIESFIKSLNSPTFLERESASEALVKIGADAIPHLGPPIGLMFPRNLLSNQNDA